MSQVKRTKKQDGFVLIVTMILLLVVSLLVLSGMRGGLLGERMAGNAMDRNLAKLAAEQAITQGLARLQANATACLDTGCSSANTVGMGPALTAATAPDTWVEANSVDVAIAVGQLTSAKFLINWLNNAAFTAAPRNNCKAYSVMGKGVGQSADSVVVLQTVSYVCPAD